ncbi:SMC family ATPase [Paraconexibacter antarcticus]|uniref:Nuclease SbcCD subunit C n=1 Tax=Paraconexibacter antarcticus TaxID=2949664 RepID=A0ABY5DMW8_9ACTN|nr:SMC family ATPase [Paraconexibacter antarcticus]UTI63366.1 SMC family ATPase [Paraconexibacter antarcticus]
MRPLELRLTGLRSYRTDTTVDFSDVSLLAIIGATGSGKSSLLEAITYALYGTATWGGRNVKSLIADGSLRMTVSLTFDADGQQWKITRSAPSGNYPPSTQELVCLSDPERPKVDGSTEVKTRIQALVGLDYDGFKSCVLLPQGRFDQLLKSATAERVGILKGILGLDALDQTRGRAQALEAVVTARYEELLRARGQFMPDPHAEHTSATATIAELTPRADELEKLEQRAQALLEEARADLGEEKDATAGADRITDLNDAALIDRLRTLEQLEADLVRRHSDAAAAAQVAERDAAAARAAINEASEQHRSTVAITRMLGTLDTANSALRAIIEDRAASQRRRAELAEDLTTLDVLRERNTELQRTLTQHVEAEQSAESAAREAKHAADQVLGSITQIVSARQHLNSTELALKGLSAGLALAQEHEIAVRAAHDEAFASKAAAQLKMVAVQRDQAAATAAHGCQPGEACPVCAQTLPGTFIAPQFTIDHAAMATTLAAAEETERAVFSELTRLQAAVGTATTQHADATDNRDRAAVAWAQVAHTPLPNDLDPATLADDEPTHAQVNAPANLAVEQYRAATSARSTTEGEHQRANATLEAKQNELKRRDGDLRSEVEASAKREAEVRGRLAQLPSWADVPQSAAPIELAEAEARLEAALEEAKHRDAVGESTADTAKACQTALNEAQQRIQTEIHGPALSERATLHTLAAEVNRHHEQPLPKLATSASIGELISAGEQITTAAQQMLTQLQDTATRARAAAQSKQQEGSRMVSAAGFENSAQVHEAVIDVVAELKTATSQREQAAAQLKPAAELDAMLSQAQQLRAGLHELAFQLGDGRFTGYVVAQRQRALLILASGIFGDVTAGQYGFTEDFKIVDRQTGAARTPETLSGGETFLASLALALGLVELAGRSGGRLQALFLDEGFGSLDPDALDQALNELERRADTGRLIAMISHVPAIAERIEQVLHVTKTPQGSAVRLLTDEQRAELLMHDATEQAAAAT